MTFSTEFFMTENGRIGGTEDGEPIKFEFSGDDDVWVFVDGRLVLDLGGIHDKVSGEIDFAEGTSQVYYTNVTNGRETRETKQNIWEMLGTTADTWRSSTRPHTLQVFYLERGKGASNCKISFNLPQKNCVEVTKVMGNQTSNQDELDALNRQTFTFQAYSKETGTENWNAFKNRPYYVYNSNGQYVRGDVTGDNGEFSLRFGQTARFYLDQDLYAGKDADFYVKEVNAQNSEKDWETSINAVKQDASETDESPVLVIEAMDDEASQTSALTTYTFSCTNTVSAQAYDDLVVLDYGKPVQVDVLANDTLYGTSRTVGGIRVHAEDKAESFTEDQDLALTNGAAKIAENKVEYTPDKFMDSIDRLDYVVGDADSATETNVATVSMIPATNVYYEDDFKVADSGNATIEYSGTYSQSVKEGNASDKYQSDENRVYGQDPAYAQQNGFSDGSATSMDQGATATFTFKGTGVDIYTKTDTESPLVGAWIYRETADENGEMVWKAVQSVIVDNKYDVQGEGLYQIPTICFDAEQYGTYKVKIQVMSATSGTAKYYLDGIRIYNPVDPEGKDAEESESAYQLAGEAGPVVTEIREILLGAGALTDESGQANGMVYLDNLEPGEDGTSEISDYEKDGPKHEVYLSEGNAIAFTLKDYTDAQQVYLAAKAPEGTAATLRVTDGTRTKDVTIDSTSEQYFEITPTSRGHVVIENVSAGDTAGLISITKIRTTNMQGKETDEQALNFVVNADTISYTQEFAVMSLNADNAAIEDPDGTGEDVDIDIDIENPQPDETPEPSQDRPVLNLIQSIVSGFKDLFSSLW